MKELSGIGSAYSFGTVGSLRLHLVFVMIGDRPADVGDEVERGDSWRFRKVPALRHGFVGIDSKAWLR